MMRITKNYCLLILAFFPILLKGQNAFMASEKFRATLGIINQNYVDSVNPDKLVEDAIVSMLEELDPHSVYISKEELNETNEPLVGNFEGVGIQFQIVKDTLLVVDAIPGGPSEKVGIHAGDKIIKVDDELIANIGIKNKDVMKLLRGDKGTKVKVSILRKDSNKLIDFTITRGKIPIYSIEAAYMAAPEIGYIKLVRFAQTSMTEYMKAFSELQKSGMKHMILDLRGNSGGYLRIAEMLSDEFLKDKQLIVYTEGISSPKKETFATSSGGFQSGKLVIMIDEFSASASEIVSGAVQDWDRGLIIGRRSFGKGLVQNQYPLPDGSAMRLTIARYYTPSGRSIQKSYKNGVDEYNKDIQNRYINNEFLNSDSIHFVDSLKYFTSQKRVVYGGGGIMPDIFIPLDTTMNSEYYTLLYRKNLISQFVFNYLELHREEITEKYTSLYKYKEGFVVDEKLMKQFIIFAEAEGVKEDLEGLKKSSDIIAAQLKALIARSFWQTSAYYEIINEKNDVYQKALEVIQDKTFKKMKLEY